MTQILQLFETVTPSLTDVSTGNSGGSGSTAFDLIFKDATAVFRSNNAHPAGGSMGAELSAGISEAVYGEWSTAFGTKTQVFGRAYVWFDALPTSTVRLFQALDGATNVFGVQIGTAGKVALIHYPGGVQTTLATMTTVIGTAQLVRIEWNCICSATTGTLEAKLFNSPGSTTPTETLTPSPGTLDTKTQMTKYRFGRAVSASAATGTWYMDALGVDDTAYIGPLPVVGGVYLPRRRGGRSNAVMEAIR